MHELKRGKRNEVDLNHFFPQYYGNGQWGQKLAWKPGIKKVGI